MSKQRLFVMAMGAIGIAAMFMPLVSVMGISVNGFGLGALGYLIALSFFIPLILGLVGKKQFGKGAMIGIIICAVIAALLLVLNMTNLLSEGMGLGLLGAGFWLALGVAIAMPIGMLVLKDK